MPLKKTIFRPGINREGTAYDNEGGWFDCNLVRFRQGRPEKFGGWEKLSSATYEGTARALHGWISLGGTKYLGLGTHLKYYVESGTVFNDITPIRSTTSAGDVTFSASNGDATITVTDTAHGAVQNDFVTFSGAATLGGNITAAVLNQEYQIATIVNANSYTIEAKDTSGSTVTANASDSGNGGSSVVGTYQINVGLDVYVPGTGWGINGWGEGTFGSTSSLSDTNQLRLWTHDNFGEDLIINPRNSGIYKWTENNGVSTRAVELSGISGANLVPTKGLQVITSEVDRHLIVLGADPISGTSRTGTIDPMLIAFSDQENELEFEPLSTNTAGSLRLSSGSSIIGAVKSRQEILVWTDTALYSMQFVGPPFTFAINLINEGTGLVGPNAAVTAPSAVFFMSYNNFYAYNGAVQTLPCSVQNYVFGDINLTQSFKISAFTIKDKNEVGWFYCSSSSSEIDRYVIYNYAEELWFYGQLVRTAWLDSGIENYPRAVNGGYLFKQEIGFNDDGSPMTGVFIESSDFDLDDGEKFVFARRIIPDFKFIEDSNNGSVNVVVKTRNFPGDSLTTNSTNEVSSTTQQSHIRARARQMALRIESNDDATNDGNLSIGWRLGATRIDIKSDGKR
jgi:hypothetical protein|tara:strand:- start:1391 stop:3259 length:1869 start_codon:yes stop_codon:yes gene_type:complete